MKPISTKLGTKHPWVKGNQVCSNKGLHPFPREDNSNNTLTTFTTSPISTILGTKHPWVKGIQVCTNEWPCPFPWRENYKIVKLL